MRSILASTSALVSVLLAARALATTAASTRSKSKSVTAHIMFGEIQNYKVEDHVADQLLAREAGIDAFAVNTGHDTYDIEHMNNIFEAAKQTGFPLFFSFDMLHYNRPNASNWILYDYLLPYASRPEYYKLDGKIVVSTFSGNKPGSFINDVSTFKEANQVWQSIIDTAKTFNLDIYLAPFWLDRSAVESPDSDGLELSGVGNWFGFGNVNDKSNVTAAEDAKWHDSTAARDVDYWAPVSHSFSVHQVQNNNYVMKGGNWLLATHYRDLIELGDKSPDHIELITFNDWGESTYFSPVRDRANQPHETVDTAVYANADHDHVPFLWLSAYYNSWFKTGVAPKITNDVIVWWYRGQQTQAAPPNDPLGQPAGWQTLTDTIWAVVLIADDSRASRVVIHSGGKDVESQTVSKGVNLIRGEFQPGKQSISLRDGAGEVLISGSGVDITSSPPWWDYNYFSYIVPANFRPADFLDLGSVQSSTAIKLTSPTSSQNSTEQSPSSSSTWWVAVLLFVPLIVSMTAAGLWFRAFKLRSSRSRTSQRRHDSSSSAASALLSDRNSHR